MNPEEEKSEKKPREKYSLEGIIERMAYGETHAGKVAHRLGLLPAVDKNGHSECPFAETLYAQKEEAACGLSYTIEHVASYLPVVDEELARSEKELREIRSRIGDLHHDEPKNELGRAARDKARWCKEVRFRREQLIDLLRRMKDTQKRSEAKKWPLGKPRKPVAALPGLNAGMLGLPGANPPVQPIVKERVTPLSPPPSMTPPMPPSGTSPGPPDVRLTAASMPPAFAPAMSGLFSLGPLSLK